MISNLPPAPRASIGRLIVLWLCDRTANTMTATNTAQLATLRVELPAAGSSHVDHTKESQGSPGSGEPFFCYEKREEPVGSSLSVDRLFAIIIVHIKGSSGSRSSICSGEESLGSTPHRVPPPECREPNIALSHITEPGAGCDDHLSFGKTPLKPLP